MIMGKIHKKAARTKTSAGEKLFSVITYAIIIIITVLCLYPLYFTVIASFSDSHAVYSGEVNLWPVNFSLDAYTAVFKNNSIWLGYANTIFYTVAGTALNLFLTIPAAYALSKKRMYGRTFLMTLFIITMYFGGGMIPTYLLFNKMHLVNTRWIMIINGGLSVYNLVVARTYFQNNIPESLCEAARIDGANEIYIFGKMVLPLSGPIVAVITLYYAVSHWSSYFGAMIYLTDQKLHPLQLVLRKILILNEKAYEAALEADASGELLASAAKQAELALTMKYSLVFIASLPMLIAYPFIQKYFVKGLTVGALKG